MDKGRYSYKELEEILLHQVPQYLHDSSTTHGILLLVRLESWLWKIEGRALNRRAEQFHASNVHGRRVVVLGIDLAWRSTPSMS
ncbi:hypothetical protein ACN28S_32185 [Cystobacter fuscus]